MALITLRCKNCGSGMTINPDAQTATCTHCGSTFLMVDLLDEKDMSFSKSMTPENLQQKIDFAEALKKGETYLYQAEYELAEESFKRAIQLSDKNHKGYLGVVKAKTANLNKIPDSDDYKEFAKFALKTATPDDLPYVKSELAKLDLLEKEKERKKQEEKIGKEKNRLQKNNYADNEKFWGKIAMTVVFVITLMILLSIFITNQKNKPDDDAKATYEITSVETFRQYQQKDDFLNSIIVIKNDINFDNIEWIPLGSHNKPFTGEFRGNHHKLSNLKIKVGNAYQTNYIGFFGYVKNATISGLVLDNVSISDISSYPTATTNNIGFVCGYADDSKITECEVLNTNSLDINHSKNIIFNIGGVAGASKNSSISKTYSNASIECVATNLNQTNSLSLKLYVGGIVGYIESVSIKNCYSTSEITNNISSSENLSIIVYCGGIVGYNYTQKALTISKCYFAGSIDNYVNSSSNTSYVAGIVAYGANFGTMSNNFALFEEDTFIKNGVELGTGSFHDHSTSTSSVEYVTLSQLLEKIAENYSTSTWTDVNTIMPSLKK